VVSYRRALQTNTNKEPHHAVWATRLSLQLSGLEAMENVWITTAEIQVQPGDMPSGDTLGFMRVTMWASSHDDLHQKLSAYLAKYQWRLISIDRTAVIDSSFDYGDEVNQMIDETLRDQNAIRLGTYYSYKPS